MKHEHFKQGIRDSLKSDFIKEYQTSKDLKLSDGSFIKKGTHFIIEGLTHNNKYEIHFCDDKDNIYVPNDGNGDGYYFNIYEIKKLVEKKIERCRSLFW